MSLFLGLLFGSIGSGYLIYAKRQYNATFLVCGFVLIIYPYFVTNPILCVLAGAAITAVPFVIRAIEERG